MAERLDTLSRLASDRNPFLNRRRLTSLRATAPPLGESDAPSYTFSLVHELVASGETEAAIEELSAWLERVEQAEPAPAPQTIRLAKRRLAMTHLRLAEEQNCLLAHGSQSCILPITGDGVHVDKAPALSAAALFEELLDQTPEDLELRWLLTIATMSAGRYSDTPGSNHLLLPELFDAEHKMSRFVDVAPQVGLDTVSLAGGSVVDDLDGDGLLDVVVSSWSIDDPLRIFHNLGNGSFEESSSSSGLEGLTGGLNLVHADFDNDGDVDLFVLRGGWLGRHGRHPNSLLRNEGELGFVDVTEELGLLDFAPTQTAAWADYDNDGWLDLFVGVESLPGRSESSRLWRNVEGRAFEDVSAAEGLELSAFVKGVAWGDVNNDRLPDLYLSILGDSNRLYVNGGPEARPRFVDATKRAGVSEPIGSFPCWFFDYDNDGWQDLFVAGYSSTYEGVELRELVADYLGQPTSLAHPKLYRNLGNGTFEDRTATARLDRVLYAMGANFGDLDNDGWLDIYVGTGGPGFELLMPNRMFRNAKGIFQDVTTSGGFGHLQKGHGVSFADLDNDGDQDVFTVLGGAYEGDIYNNALFLNPGSENHWLTLRLEGALSNRSAIGARIRVIVGDGDRSRRFYRTVSTGGSFGGSPLRQEIGLGRHNRVRELEVAWPSGLVETFNDVAPDRHLSILEGEGALIETGLPRVVLP